MKINFLVFHLILLLSCAIKAQQLGNKEPERSPAQAEAGYCADGSCQAASPEKSNIMTFCEAMKARLNYGDEWKCLNTSIFDDGNDRIELNDLRKKNPSQLTLEEKAILEAAPKVGIISLCNGKKGGNAFLIMYRGRPAVVTSGHRLKEADGSYACSLSSLNPNYLPNASYYDPTKGKPDSFIMRKVELESPPVNYTNIKDINTVATNEKSNSVDFVIFYLKEDITKDRMPGGGTRGYLKHSQSGKTGKAHLIGVAPDIKKGLVTAYQKSCNYKTSGTVILNDCDTINGSSGSLLGTLENNEIKFKGLINGGRKSGKLARGMERFDSYLNIALPSSEIYSYRGQ